MQERWLPIPGFEGLYEISDLGRVRVLERVMVRVNRWGHPNPYKSRTKIKKLRTDAQGYLKVELYKEGKKTVKKVHQLVMEVFVGPPAKGYVTDHINSDRADARLENLEYVTYRENSLRGASGLGKVGRTCKLPGVSKTPNGNYVARKSWMVDGKQKQYNLGTYKTPEEAHKAYSGATLESAQSAFKLRANQPGHGRLQWREERGHPRRKS